MNIHMHMTNGRDALEDVFGADVPEDQIRAECIATARESIQAAGGGEDWTGWRVEAWSDDGQTLVASVPFPA